MITLNKRGQIYLNNQIICNRPGVTIEIIREYDTKIGVSKTIKNPYTISIANEGIPISFFSVKKKELTKDDLDAAWLIDYNKAYFLSTLNNLNGYKSQSANKEFIDIVSNIASEEMFLNLDQDYAWTFLLDPYVGKLIIICIWDVECQQFIHPSSPLWKVPNFCETPFFLKNENGITEKLTKTQKTAPLDGCDVKVITGQALLVTIYCEDEIFTIRVMTWNDMVVSKIKSRSVDKFDALLIAKCKEEDTTLFEDRHFTNKEIKHFNSCLRKGILQFKKEIYQKSFLKRRIRFPEKIYNTIRLGDIIDENTSYVEKQDKAWNELKKCTRGWKIKALYEFYKMYMDL